MEPAGEEIRPEAIRAVLTGQPTASRAARTGDELLRLTARVLELETELQRERFRRREAERGLTDAGDRAAALRTENERLRAVIRQRP